ncbi:MAG: AraC family transcriptional regulator [Desulfatibacillum sp.]|nr:AraC family transcriptional regulator [Desulfatibacillum sp.]
MVDAGIDDKCLSDPDGRIGIEKMGRLWELAVERSGDPCLGLGVVKYLHPITFHALGPALLASRNLQEALERLCRDYPIISDEVEVRIAWLDEGMTLCFTPFPGCPLPVGPSVDAFMAVAISYARMLDDASLNPVKVEFMHEPAGELKRYTDLFRAPVYFAKPDNLILFSNHDVHRTLPTANAEIARQNDKIVMNYLARYKKARIDQQVRRKLIELLPLGEPSMEITAKSLGMSRRSLHRYLQNQGAAFRDILDDTRKHLADLYIRQPHLSVTEVAFKLGYSDSSNFSRAFRRWFNMSPITYRKDLRATN